jgi:sec-independent protein translocase protein TatC
MADEPTTQQNSQTLTDHLTELRDRLIRSLWAIALGAIACWIFKEQIFNIIRGPIAKHLPAGGLVFTNPMDLFVAHVKVALMSGVVLATPVWVYQAWMFIAPGLYSHERKYSLAFIVAGTGLFLIGILFVYFLVLPSAFEFLFHIGGGVEKPMITINEYLSFFMTTTLIFGAAFELPLVLTLLGMIGIVDKKFLREKRRFAVVLLAVLSAVVTPPDALSMMMLLVPLCLLYEISIILVGVFGRKREPV